jgi:hypothetical protein
MCIWQNVRDLLLYKFNLNEIFLNKRNFQVKLDSFNYYFILLIFPILPFLLSNSTHEYFTIIAYSFLDSRHIPINLHLKIYLNFPIKV